MELVRDLLIFIAVMFALYIVLIVVISMLPNDNPLKRIPTALSYRIGATLAAGMIAVPVEPIPGLDVLYDIDEDYRCDADISHRGTPLCGSNRGSGYNPSRR